MLTAYQMVYPDDAVEYLPPMVYSNNVEHKGEFGTVETEVGITDPSYIKEHDRRRNKQMIIRRMRRHGTNKCTNRQE